MSGLLKSQVQDILAVQQSVLENNLTDIPLFGHKLVR
jgi:hypothetical protein